MTAVTDEVVLLWRPGCGFCLALRHGLDKAGLDYAKRNIWQDADAAALVRRFAGGSETVPTVLVGEIGLVNPSSGRVLRTVHEVAPERLPEGYEPPAPGKVARFVGRLVGTHHGPPGRHVAAAPPAGGDPRPDRRPTRPRITGG